MLQCGSIPRAALCIDFTNAFSTIGRVHAMDPVYTDYQLRGLHKCVSFLSGRPSPHYALDTTTGSINTSLTQLTESDGRPLRSALFALHITGI